MPVIYRPFLEKLGGNTNANSYVGNSGELFYDPATTTLRISDGTTPGGSVVSAGGGGGDTGDITFVGSTMSSSDDMTIEANGAFDINITANNNTWTFYEYGLMKFPVKTWAEIYDAVELGQKSFISDSDLEAIPANFGEIVGGGGANVAPVWSDGTNWRIG